MLLVFLLVVLIFIFITLCNVLHAMMKIIYLQVA